MSTPPALKRNGKGKRLSCARVEECETVQTAADALGMIAAELGTIKARLNSMTEHLSNVSKRQVLSDQREERWLEELGQMTRSLVALRRGEVEGA